MLFDAVTRTYLGRANIGESEFDFLNRSARPEAEAARGQIEDLLSRYPKDGMNHLLARFRSDDQNFHGALFELVLNGLFIELGCEVDLCDLDPSQRRPDFSINHAGKRCYVEATVVDPIKGTLDFNDNEKDVIGKLDSLSGQGFGLNVDTEGTLTRLLPKSDVIKPFQDLIDRCEPSDVPLSGLSSRSRTGPVAKISDGNWQLTGRLFAIDSDRFVHVQSGEAKWVRPEKPIERRLTEKAKRYGELDAPLVVALNARDLVFSIRDDALDALFGKVGVEITFDNRTSPPTVLKEQMVRKPGGIWQTKSGKPRYTRLKAVILFERLDPFKLAAPVIVYFNPFVDTSEVPKVFRCLNHAIDRDGNIEYVIGENLQELLFGQPL